MFLHKLPVTKTHSGATRRVGIELEFSGISLDEAAGALRAFTGNLNRHTAVVWSGEHSELGRFQLELDSALIKRLADEQELDPDLDVWAGLVHDAAALVVPIEIVCPPIPIDRLEQLDQLIELLDQRGAKGTDESLIAAYGLHINVETPELDASVLFRYLKSFCLLQWWLSESHNVDWTRKLSTYVKLFPEPYVRQLCLIDHADWSGLMNTYMEFNDTRNRALDMFPLFSEYDEALIKKRIGDPRIHKRPAFHYRLPNCEIGTPGWSLSQPWALWCVVERLANDAPSLAELSKQFLNFERPLLGVNRRQWIGFLDQWLNDRSLV